MAMWHVIDIAIYHVQYHADKCDFIEIDTEKVIKTKKVIFMTLFIFV